MDDKQSKGIAYRERLLPLKPYNPYNVSNMSSRDNLKKLYLHFHKNYGQ